jgi:starch-binding outer membrane protein, SusD/RagB family
MHKKLANSMKKIIMTLMIFTALTISCTEDFLDNTPTGTVEEIQFYNSMQSINQAITACYSVLCSREIFDDFYLFTMGSIASDDAEAGGSDLNDRPTAQSIDQMTHSPADAVFDIEMVWRYAYRGIFFCNQAIKKIPIVLEATGPSNQAALDEKMAEARFLRAFYYFVLVQVYGGVPIIDHVQASADEYYLARNSVKEVHDFIQKDLLFARQYLPTKAQNGINAGKASSGAANALLAKSYLYESSYAKNYPVTDDRFTGCELRWDSALYFAEQVMADPSYELVGINGETFDHWWNPGNTDAYRYLFTVAGDNCAESVFEIQNLGDQLGYDVTRGTYATTFQTPRKYFTNDAQTRENDGWYGWGLHVPTDNLVAEFEPGDVRIKTAIALPGDSMSTLGGWSVISYSLSCTGHYGKKYIVSYEEFYGNRSTDGESPINIRQIRFADVVLMAAEAALERGDNVTARDYINMVRTRARMAGGGSVDTDPPANLTGTVTLDDLIHERRVELALEGHRFFDLVRWGIADELIQGTLEGGPSVHFVAGKHEFYPIPEAEIGRHQGKLVQYSGWQ